jgi:hypothetical protein
LTCFFLGSWKEPPSWFKRLGDLLKLFGSQLRVNLFSLPAVDAKRAFSVVWSVFGTALQSDTATFPQTPAIRALLNENVETGPTIRASVGVDFLYGCVTPLRSWS